MPTETLTGADAWSRKATQHANSTGRWTLRSSMFAQVNDATLILSILLAGAASVVFFRYRPAYRTLAAYALAAVAVVLSARSAMLGPAMFVLACTFLVRARGLATFASLAVLWIVSAAYYALNWTLTQKALSMLALGLALALVVLATSRVVRTRAPVALIPASPGAAGISIAAGVLLTGTLATFSITSAEEILRNGRPIFIELRPVDPRSLLQGDYMAVAFDTAKLPQPSTAGNREVVAVAAIDDRKIATLQRVAPPGEPHSADEIVLIVRTKSRRWFVGSDDWYFQDGRGKPFEEAKFGIFRVGKNGRPLLTGLADKDMRPIL